MQRRSERGLTVLVVGDVLLLQRDASLQVERWQSVKCECERERDGVMGLVSRACAWAWTYEEVVARSAIPVPERERDRTYLIRQVAAQETKERGMSEEDGRVSTRL
jgi:hypothetical protein